MCNYEMLTEIDVRHAATSGTRAFSIYQTAIIYVSCALLRTRNNLNQKSNIEASSP